MNPSRRSPFRPDARPVPDPGLALRTRREFLRQGGFGFGGLALGYLLSREGVARGAAPAGEGAGPGTSPGPGISPLPPLHPRPPHFPGRAKSVIWLFMEGGPSHLDLFDPKPELDRMSGQPMPESFGRPITAMGTAGNTLMASRRHWKQHGRSGLWISDWFPRVAGHADKLCVLRSC